MPTFGDWFTGIYASDDNPIKHGMYVRTIRRTGRMNRGTHYELTDGKGAFWETPVENCEPRQGSGHERVIPATDLRAFIEAERRIGWGKHLAAREQTLRRLAARFGLDKHTAKAPSGGER